MADPCDDLNQRIRAIIERPIADLVELGLEGGTLGAVGMLAFQYLLRLQTAADRDRLESLRDEIDDYLEAAAEPPVPPLLRLVP